MQMRKLMSALAVGTLAMAGGLAFGPAEMPEQAENGCRGINEARGQDGGNGQAGDVAGEVLNEVADLLSGNDCEDHENASGTRGRS